MATVETINRVLRDFERYSGDGKPNAPVGAPLPIGDPRSGVHNLSKADFRAILVEILQTMGDPEALAEILQSLGEKAAVSDLSTEQSRRRASNKDAGVIPLGSVMGTNAITAALPTDSWMDGVTIGTRTMLMLIPTATNTGAVTLSIDGGPAEAVLRSNGFPLQAGDLKYDRAYLLRRRGGTTWRISAGDVSVSDLGSAAYRTEGYFAPASRMGAVEGRATSLEARTSEIEGQVGGILDGTRVVGDWDASVGAYPDERPDGTAIQGGDTFNVAVGGSVAGMAWAAGDMLVALKDSPAATYAGNWSRRTGTATVAAQVKTSGDRTVQEVISALPIYNVWDYYEATDSGINMAVNRAGDLAAANGGGDLVLENRGAVLDYNAPLTLHDYTFLSGRGMPRIRQAGGANISGVSSPNAEANSADGLGNGAIRCFGARDLIIDGNREENTAGHGFVTYGWDFLLSNVQAVNMPQDLFKTLYDRPTGVPAGARRPYAWGGHVERMTGDYAGGHGWHNRVSDVHARDINIQAVSLNGHKVYDGIRAERSMRLEGVNIWTSETTWPATALWLDQGCTVANVHLESAELLLNVYGSVNQITNAYLYNGRGAINFIVSGNYNIIALGLTKGFWTATTGIQVGLSNKQAAYNRIAFTAAQMDAGAVSYVNGAYNSIEGTYYTQTNGAVIVAGTPADSEDLSIVGMAGSTFINVQKRTRRYSSIAAAGSTQADATPVTAAAERVTGADGVKGVILPAAWGGREIEIANNGTAPLLVYPASGEQFMGKSGNLPISIPANTAHVMRAVRSGIWAAALT